MCNNGFCNLHSHSSYSFGDSILGVDKLVSSAKEAGHKSVTLTDHGSLVGMVPFVKEAEKQNIKWIIGMESYYVDDEVKDSEKKSRHLTTLAANEKGWKNLLHLTWFANVSVKDGGGFFYRPRFTDKEIFDHQEGLIFSSACLNGVITTDLMNGDEMNARLNAMKWRDNVEHFYIEIMPHRFEEQIKANLKLIEIARDLNIPILATLDVHYEKQEQHKSWLINGAIRRRQTKSTFESHEISADMFYKTSDQIIADFQFGGVPNDVIEEAMQNSLKISEMCNFQWKDRMNKQPVFNASIKAPEHLKTIAWQGLCKRFGGAKFVPHDYVQRLKYEWEVICQMGYADYFLILHDFVSYGKKNGVIFGPGRGSAAGCMMLWALHVTEIDSIKYRLSFERFLNPSRVQSPPDLM